MWVPRLSAYPWHGGTGSEIPVSHRSGPSGVTKFIAMGGVTPENAIVRLKVIKNFPEYEKGRHRAAHLWLFPLWEGITFIIFLR